MPRNLTDDMIRALAKSGGVVQINFGCEFISQKSIDASAWTNPAVAKAATEATASIADPAQRQAAIDKWLAERMHQATIDDVVAHIDHVRQVAGIGHVGLGSDFDGVPCVPAGLDDVSKWPNLTRKLLERGYTPADIRKVYGANFLRFMKAVERAATVASSR
jgi:membrane dipeptidase